jgi:hypothetical protein
MSLFDDILPQNKPTPPAGGNPPAQDDPLVANPQITITESTPMDIAPPLVEAAPIENIPEAPTPVEKVPVDTSGILIIDEADTTPITPTQVPISPIAEVSVPVIAIRLGGEAIQAPDIASTSLPPSSLFSLVSDAPVSPVSDVPNIANLSSATADLQPISSDLSPITNSLSPTPPTFQSTEDLIAHEISDLDEFILSLDAVERAKLEQEAEYKNQKEHFAELEIQAESEHQKVLTERAHAEKMKAYLEEEVQ